MYAHTRANSGPEHWEPLTKHLSDVAREADAFAAAFGASTWGKWLGACHDLGKLSVEFQDYLFQSNSRDARDAGVEEQKTPGRVNHSSFGARYVHGRLGDIHGEILAYCIAGHHAGLPDATSPDDTSSGSTLRFRLDPERQTIPYVDPPALELPQLSLPPKPLRKEEAAFGLAFFTRMLFSCLIDADRSCTETFCDPDKAEERMQARPSLRDLLTALDAHMLSFAGKDPALPVNRVRASVLEQCRMAANISPGFFSLQVPTGGGKTLASLAFALKHAAVHGRRRVITAIPYTSIIEQTAGVYREALGELALIEHHTNLQPKHDTRANQLGTENWDAPLVVTTNVQLLESLFAAATTPSRKLHRIAHSVIVLDEAQVLPTELLAPTLTALRMLVDHYGCTVVLCTATQPALEYREDFPFGLKEVRPIIAEPALLFEALRRVEVHHAGRLSDEALVTRLAAEPRVLCIVNTRPHAAKLFSEMRARVGSEGCFHLSTLMCGAHRRRVLQTIRERAASGYTCRVVSTQLIEAGVDLDLPVVYRAEAGFDSIAQAAGRCNREGRLQGLGQVHVFEAETPLPPGYLQQSAESARELLRSYKDPLTPQAIDAYFRMRYWRNAEALDRHGILELARIDGARKQTHFQFRAIADNYVLIRDKTLPVLIPFDKNAKALISLLENGHVPFVNQRQLQPYLVSVREHVMRRLEKDAIVRAHDSGVWILLRDDVYDEDMGLNIGSIGLDPRAWDV